jgi:pentapeptide MXKDX repeat protein
MQHLPPDSSKPRPTGAFSVFSFSRADRVEPQKTFQMPVRRKRIFHATGNKRERRTVLKVAASVAFKKPPQRDDQPMTIRTRIALAASVAVVSLSLALAPAAFAQDKMGKDDGMKKDTMSKDGMKDGMKKDDGMKDGMKKDDGMKDGMKKDDMKK